MELKLCEMEEGKLYLVEFGDNQPGLCFRINKFLVQLGEGKLMRCDVFEEEQRWDYTETNVTIKDLSLAFGSILEDVVVKR